MFVMMSIIDKWLNSTCLAESVVLLLATVGLNQCFAESSMWPLHPCQEQGAEVALAVAFWIKLTSSCQKLKLWATSYAMEYFIK